MITTASLCSRLTWFLNTMKIESYETMDISLLACLFG